MIIYRRKTILPKLHERIFVAPQQGIAPQGMNTVNRYTPKTEYTDTKVVSKGSSAFVGHKNPNIGSDINDVRKVLRRKFDDGRRYSKHRANNELPLLNLTERSGVYKQFKNKGRYVQPTAEEYITAADTLQEKAHRGKRILRIDAIDSISSKAATLPKYQEYLGPDSGEVQLSSQKTLGKNALISVPKDTGFDSYVDEVVENKVVKNPDIEIRRRQLRDRYKMWYGLEQENKNKNKIKVKSDNKRLRKLLKKNHKLVNGLDRNTLEFMYGTKNPNIEKMMKNARRIL